MRPWLFIVLMLVAAAVVWAARATDNAWLLIAGVVLAVLACSVNVGTPDQSESFDA